MSKWRVGIYVRLSSEDKVKNGDESNSIINQKGLIEYYLSNEKGIKIYDVYTDDGFTGTDFNRPGFQRLKEDIYNGKVNTIVVKDLSRLGRDYLGVGELIETLIPKYNIRFISINERIDSYLKPESIKSIEVPIKNLMNEGYSKDISYKIRSSLRISKENGNYIGNLPPYGYIKDSEDCHKLLIDPEAAKIVKKIFDLALNGYSKIEIINELNDEHILTPTQYFKNKLKLKVGRLSEKWNTRTIDNILKNETYIGNLVQGKKRRISYKVHNVVRNAEEDWICIENHHEGIIERKIFKQIQLIVFNRNSKANTKGKYTTYTGYLKCNECKCNLRKFTRPNSDNNFYYCNTYIKNKSCSKHYITEKEVDDIVLAILNTHIDIMCDLEKELNERVSVSSVEYKKEISKIRLVEVNKEIQKYEKLLKEVIKDYEKDYISKEDFDSFNKEYIYNLNELRIEKEELEKKKISGLDLKWLNNYKKIGKLTTVDRNIISKFINNIYIDKNKNIRIEFKYKEQYEDAIKYLKSQNNMV